MRLGNAVIDGSNALYLQAPREPRPNIGHVLALARAVEEAGMEPMILFDPGIRTLLTDAEFETLSMDPRAFALPDGKDMGPFILETADRMDAAIVSNNIYAEYAPNSQWMEKRRIPITVVDGKPLLLLRQEFRRAG